MAIFDLVLAGLLIIGGIRGFKEGIILEIAGFLGLFLALFGALQLVEWGAMVLSGYWEIEQRIVPIVSFILLFLVIIISVHITGRLVKGAFHITPFGFIDNLLGAVLGVVKWALGISLIFWILGVVELNLSDQYLNNSIILPYIYLLAPFFIDFITYLIPYFQELLSSIEVLFSKSKD